MANPKPVELPVASSFAQIKNSGGLREKIVPMPEWGVAMRIRELTREEVKSFADLEDSAAEALSLSVAVLEPKLTVEEATELLASKGFGPVDRLLDEILELSGMGAEFRQKNAGLLRP